MDVVDDVTTGAHCVSQQTLAGLQLECVNAKAHPHTAPQTQVNTDADLTLTCCCTTNERDDEEVVEVPDLHTQGAGTRVR